MMNEKDWGGLSAEDLGLLAAWEAATMALSDRIVHADEETQKHLLAIANAKARPQITAGLVRFEHGTLYSTRRVTPGDAAAGVDLRLFGRALGQSGEALGFDRPLTRRETNVMITGSTPHNVAWRVQSVRWAVFGDAADVAQIAEHCALSWDFSQTSLAIGPLDTPTGQFEQNVVLSGLGGFAILLRCAPGMKLANPVDVRVTLHGPHLNLIECG